MKILATLRLKSLRNLEFLNKAFFKNVKMQNKMFIQGDIVKIEFFVKGDVPPQDLMVAMSHCEIRSLEYDLGENKSIITEDDENFKVEDKPLHTEKEKTEKQTTEPEEKENSQEKGESQDEKQCEENPSNGKTVEELKNLLESNINLSEQEIVKWTGILYHREYFSCLIRVARKVDKITWENLENALKNVYLPMSSQKRYCIKYISTLFNGELTMIKFLKTIVKYLGKVE